MKKSVSSQQLLFNFEYETTAPVQPSQVEYHLSRKEFEDAQLIEQDLLHGRAAYLYKLIERDMAFQRESEKHFRQLDRMRASIYQ